MQTKHFILCFMAIALSACASAVQPAAPAAPASTVASALQITSPSFAPGAAIPRQFTCSGENLSPELTWSGAPADTKSFALLVEDPDAPMGIWIHWVVYNLPADSKGLKENASTGKNLPAGTLEGNQQP